MAKFKVDAYKAGGTAFESRPGLEDGKFFSKYHNTSGRDSTYIDSIRVPLDRDSFPPVPNYSPILAVHNKSNVSNGK